MTSISDALDKAFAVQSRGCVALGSPFSAVVLDLMRLDGLAGGVMARLMAPFAALDFPGHMAAATPLRPLGFVHEMVLSGEAAALAALYPPAAQTADRDALAPALKRLFETRFADAEDFVSSPPQTNEVRRTLCLLGGFTTLAQETGLPLRLFEIGASAGLNLNWDRFQYRLSDQARWGDAKSPVMIDGEWEGELPPLGPVTVESRKGCDISPIDIRSERSARRVQAYVWAGQTDRLARLQAAIAMARSTGLDLAQADAADWVEANVRPTPGVVTVLYHSVMWSYLPTDIQARIAAHMEAAGREATPQAPVAWLSMEPAQPVQLFMELALHVWPKGERRRLGLVHPHGAAVRWGASD